MQSAKFMFCDIVEDSRKPIRRKGNLTATANLD